jgi:hypothetical protein
LNKEQSHSLQCENKPCERSLADAETKTLAKKLKENFVGIIQNHIKWPEFCAHAKKVGKPPTEDWFWNWLAHQKPYWRDKVKTPPSGEEGWVLGAKFHTKAGAESLGKSNPEIIVEFKSAIRRADGTIAFLDKRECREEQRRIQQR